MVISADRCLSRTQRTTLPFCEVVAMVARRERAARFDCRRVGPVHGAFQRNQEKAGGRFRWTELLDVFCFFGALQFCGNGKEVLKQR